MSTIQICKEPKLPFSPDIQTSSKHTLQANLSTSRGWDFLRGWMSVRVRGKRSSKGVDEDEDEEEEVEEVGDRVEIGRVGMEEEKLRAVEQLKRRCDVITIKGGISFLQKMSTDV